MIYKKILKSIILIFVFDLFNYLNRNTDKNKDKDKVLPVAQIT